MINSSAQQSKETEEGKRQSVIEKNFAEMRTLLKDMFGALKVQTCI